jgi:outer membrane protein assembly factor BamB
MQKTCTRFCWIVVAAGIASPAFAQGRGGAAWTTVSGDAQRTASVRVDPKISVASMQQPGFQFLWKRKLDAGPLTQPLLLPNIIAYKGFKALAFVASASGGVYSLDYELNRMFWEQKLPARASSGAGCPARPPALTRVTALAPPVAGARGGGGGGRGRAGGPQIANGRGGSDNLFAIGGDGMVHVMNPQIGTDQIPPVKFLTPNANVVGSILVDNVLYAATSAACGGSSSGVSAIDLVSDAKSVVSYDAKGAPVVGAAAPTFGADGTIYIATGSGNSPVANSIVALESKTLVQKNWFAAASPFTSQPIVVRTAQGTRDANDRDQPGQPDVDLVVAANQDGSLYVLDGASLGGADHKTVLHKSSRLTSGTSNVTGLATWQDAAGTRWILAAVSGNPAAETKFAMNNGAVTRGSLVAFSLVRQNGVPTLQPQWISRDLDAPVTPAVVNGVVFALASGASGAARASRATPAVLYALDGATGKELWASGTTITSPVRGVGPSAGDSQVYVAAADGTLYAFGMPAER